MIVTSQPLSQQQIAHTTAKHDTNINCEKENLVSENRKFRIKLHSNISKLRLESTKKTAK